ncbi:response regulator containing a CheY-like receiver domain and an HTH DNA-binding domain [Flammeovirgaceae bacterium 311]|nr:response regulator containing a CheY-like receiver domain and an HTH DNA-binding domain [Flammeovirgaceae bacterium 311]
MSTIPISEALHQKIKEKVAQVAAVAKDLPGVVIIHYISDFSVEYISPRGEAELGLSLEAIKKLGPGYVAQFFNPEDAKEYVPKISALLERNNMEESTSFFQQVRISHVQEWVWHISSVKIFMQDEQGKPLLSITIAFPIDPLNHITTKVDRLLEENIFIRTHHANFKKLSKRECEVLRLLALGKSSPETATALFITTTTVETHRKNIKQKLNTNSFYELCQYARAFDLI